MMYFFIKDRNGNRRFITKKKFLNIVLSDVDYFPTKWTFSTDTIVHVLHSRFDQATRNKFFGLIIKSYTRFQKAKHVISNNDQELLLRLVFDFKQEVSDKISLGNIRAEYMEMLIMNVVSRSVVLSAGVYDRFVLNFLESQSNEWPKRKTYDELLNWKNGLGSTFERMLFDEECRFLNRPVINRG